MIRQSNNLSSPYVYVYVNQENQLVVESKQEGGETQTSTHTTTSLPVWLKLERKDNEINAYYSNEQTEVVSDVNWTLLTTISLTLANPFNIGLAFGNNTDVAQAKFDKAEVQAQVDDGAITITKTIGPDGGGIGIPYNEESVGVFFPEGALLRNVEVTVKLIEEPATTYPADMYSHPEIGLEEWPNKVEYTGPQVIIELPLDALDWQKRYSLEEEFKGFKRLFSVILAHFDGAETVEEGSEIRYWTGDDELELDLPRIKHGTKHFDDVNIRAYFYKSPPEVLRISVQPVDSTKFFNDNFNDNGQILPEIDTQAYWVTSPQDSPYLEGLFKLFGDGSPPFTDEVFDGCSTSIETMDFERATSAGVSNNKTPLILIHGWQGIGKAQDLTKNTIGITAQIINAIFKLDIPGESISGKDVRAPALCYWKDFIKNWTFDSKSALLNTLRQEYDLYSFGYNSLENVERNAQLLQDQLEAVFGDKKVIILAHSMGGLVANTYIQNNPNHIVKHLISLATPYRGSSIMRCEESSNYGDGHEFCTRATIDRNTIALVINLAAPLITGLQLQNAKVTDLLLHAIEVEHGSMDLSWEFGKLPPATPLCLRWGFSEETEDYECFEYAPQEPENIPNPFLVRLNQSRNDFDKRTIFYATTKNSGFNGPTERAASIVSKALEQSSTHPNDSVVPVASACFSSTESALHVEGECVGDNSLYENLIYRDDLDHMGYMSRSSLPQVMAELLRLTNRLNDIDDGTLDGNQRVYIGNKDDLGSCADEGYGEFEGDGLCDTSTSISQKLVLYFKDFDYGGEVPIFEDNRWKRFGEDADKNGYLGDGALPISIHGGEVEYEPYLDMSDFRRWRDAFINAYPTLNGDLNGDLYHLKKNMDQEEILENSEWCANYPEWPTCSFPRWADFNGDGQLSYYARATVAGLDRTAVDGKLDENGRPQLSDFEVFYYTAKQNNLWKDKHYELDDLENLISSGDVEVWPHYLFNKEFEDSINNTSINIQCVKTTIDGETRIHLKGLELVSETLGDARVRTPPINYERQIFTLATADDGNIPTTYDMLAEAYDNTGCEGDPIFSIEKPALVKLGSDELWDPRPEIYNIDDGTADGNQFVFIATETTKDSQGNDKGVVYNLPDTEALILGNESFIGNDADGNNKIGDTFETNDAGISTSGIVISPKIDMSDFRRVRDWLLISEGRGSFIGSENHPKKDISEGSLAFQYGDFNGDGQISLTARAPIDYFGHNISGVPVDANNTPLLTDLETFFYGAQETGSWDGPTEIAELEALIDSGDFEVWPKFLLDHVYIYCSSSGPSNYTPFPRPEALRSSIKIKGADTIIASHIHNESCDSSEYKERFVYTLPAFDSTGEPIVYVAYMDTLGSGDKIIGRYEYEFTLVPGKDILWDPSCQTPPNTGTNDNGEYPESFYCVTTLPEDMEYIDMNNLNQILLQNKDTGEIAIWDNGELLTLYDLGFTGTPMNKIEALSLNDNALYEVLISGVNTTTVYNNNTPEQVEYPCYWIWRPKNPNKFFVEAEHLDMPCTLDVSLNSELNNDLYSTGSDGRGTTYKDFRLLGIRQNPIEYLNDSIGSTSRINNEGTVLVAIHGDPRDSNYRNVNPYFWKTNGIKIEINIPNGFETWVQKSVSDLNDKGEAIGRFEDQHLPGCVFGPHYGPCEIPAPTEQYCFISNQSGYIRKISGIHESPKGECLVMSLNNHSDVLGLFTPDGLSQAANTAKVQQWFKQSGIEFYGTTNIDTLATTVGNPAVIRIWSESFGSRFDYNIKDYIPSYAYYNLNLDYPLKINDSGWVIIESETDYTNIGNPYYYLLTPIIGGRPLTE